MKAFFASLFSFLVLTLIIQAQPTPQKQVINPTLQKTSDFPAGSEILFNESMMLVNARHAAWIKSTAMQVNEKNMSETEVRISATNWAILGSMPEGDIEALCFLVLMQAAKSAQEDLKAIMAKVKAINNAKAQQRENLSEAQQNRTPNALQLDSLKWFISRSRALLAGANPDTVKFRRTGNNSPSSSLSIPASSKKDLDGLVDTMKNDLDSMSEMGDMESRRLQMAMDGMSKMMSTLSNLLKKISDTAQSITQNMK
ncbi:MAG: hypothetical protein H7Y01_04000 [Ferruginibacter sp.]|nr:hypothetical protein [Chitinophagaceae bacterium]